MATLPETATWEDGIYQLELEDYVEGGEGGMSNKQPTQLANRTAYLKNAVETAVSDIATVKAMVTANGEYINYKYAQATSYTDTQVATATNSLTTDDIDTAFTGE